ncbi:MULTISPECIES: wHTH domain-containing protein [unclassified Saccharothrix]|uniref:wHTH domain-containing protein n=1 Tax=unclassified Saccharothrix TaxID=2593673 RepID=UPI00307D7ADF
MPSALPGVAEFCADLAELRRQCGNPSLKWLERRVGFSDSHIGDILNGRKVGPPTWDFVSAFVTACAEHARSGGHHPRLNVDLGWWREAHGRLELPPPAGPNPWVALVEEHPVWRRVPDADRLRTRIAEVAGALFERRRRAVTALRGDSWLDDTFVGRMTERVVELLDSVLADQPWDLSAGEAALIALAPLAHQTRSAVLAQRLSTVDPTDLAQHPDPDPERQDYQRFLAGREESRLVARTTHHAEDAADIAWWLFHRWAESRPQDVTVADVLEEVVPDDPPLRTMLAESLERLVRVFRLPPEGLRDPERRKLKHRTSYARVTVAHQHVREDLIGLLLAVAHAQAIEVTRLSSTLVEHLGIPKPVRLDHLHTTLDEAHWDYTAETRVHLVASCHHEAVLESLREHVERTDVMLGAIRAAAEHGAYLEPLRALPARASADRVEPAVVNRKPAFVVPVTRLRLDESRVRELLMGEQLYGDKSLAIRELYQNALDACRYAKARLDYLEKTSDLLSRWEGRITFTQGVEGGRHYLSCADNGIGMGESELREVFSQAGVRFADQPEFLEEKARWARVGVPFYPNSRFGIGVLSYFMLADEIEVTTSRMDARGDNAGPALRVSIAGPGHLFHIQRLDEDIPHGTTVKLYLRDGDQAPSSVDALQRVLGIAEFRTTAEHDGSTIEWEPSVFTPRSEGIYASGTLVPSKQGDVIWCEDGGAVLVDGLHVHYNNQGFRGAVVNLTGLKAPKLTVDRKSIIGDVSEHLGELLTEAASELFDANAFDFDWLCDVASDNPSVADIVTSVGIRRNRRLPGKRRSVHLAVSGCFPIDLNIVGSFANQFVSRSLSRLEASELLTHTVLWRFLSTMSPTVLGELAVAGDPLPAAPSDELLLKGDRWGVGGLTIDVEPGYVLWRAATLGRAPRTVALRLRALGFEVGDVGRFPAHRAVDHTDVILLSSKLDGDNPWLVPGEVVPIGHVIAAHLHTGRPVGEIVARLRNYSYDVDAPSDELSRYTKADQLLVSRNLNGDYPWLDRGGLVGHGHVLYAAHVLGMAPEALVARLIELGFRIRQGNPQPDWLDQITPAVRDVLLADEHLLEEGVVAVSQVVSAAWKWGVSPREAARRIGDLGLPVSDLLPDELSNDDLALLGQSFGIGVGPGRLTVHVRSLLDIAQRAKREPAAVADRLVELGYSVPAREALLAGLDDFDHELISYATNGVSWHHDRAGAVIDIATRAHRAPREVVERYIRLGYEVPAFEHFDQPLTPLWRALVGIAGLVKLSPGDEVPFAHALKAVRSGSWTPGEAVEAMEAVGYRVRRGEEDGVFDRTDFDLLERLSTTKPVDMRRLILEAMWFELPLEEVARRLERMGFEVPDLAVELPELLERVPFRRD